MNAAYELKVAEARAAQAQVHRLEAEASELLGNTTDAAMHRAFADDYEVLATAYRRQAVAP